MIEEKTRLTNFREARAALIAKRSELGAHTPTGRRLSMLIGQIEAKVSGIHGPNIDGRIAATVAELEALFHQ